MHGETDVEHEDLVDVGEPPVDGVEPELSGADGVEPADSAQNARAGGELVVDERRHWAEHGQPGSLDVVHCLFSIIYIFMIYRFNNYQSIN